jgi:hypothetical protein
MLIVLYILQHWVKCLISHTTWQVKGMHAHTQPLHTAYAIDSCMYPNIILCLSLPFFFCIIHKHTNFYYWGTAEMFQLLQQLLIVLYILFNINFCFCHLVFCIIHKHTNFHYWGTAKIFQLVKQLLIVLYILFNIIFRSCPLVFFALYTNILTFTTEGQLKCSN